MISLPPFLLAMFLVTFLGGTLHWFPLAGTRGLEPVTGVAWLTDRWNHAFLPLITLAAAAFGPFYLVMRESMVDVLGEDCLVVAEAKGVSERSVRRRHAVPNALLPVVSLLALSLGTTLSGSIAVEYVYAYRGLGLLAVVAMRTRNFPLLQGIFLLFAAMVIGANLVADLVYASIDPRIRHA
jgi:peptide/nickel transport system permease protein